MTNPNNKRDDNAPPPSTLDDVVRALVTNANFGGDVEARRVADDWSAQYDEKIAKKAGGDPDEDGDEDDDLNKPADDKTKHSLSDPFSSKPKSTSPSTSKK